MCEYHFPGGSRHHRIVGLMVTNRLHVFRFVKSDETLLLYYYIFVFKAKVLDGISYEVINFMIAMYNWFNANRYKDTYIYYIDI